MKSRSNIEYIEGNGIEIGALHNPLKVDENKAKVKYIDKYPKKNLLENFPDLAQDAENIVEPDILCDINIDGLSKLEDNSQDFVIANHLIEHLYNPISLIKDFYRVTKDNGIIYIAIPDKTVTFDIDRTLTSVGHLENDYKNNINYIEKEHLQDVLNKPVDSITQKEMDHYDKTSFHVHVWNCDTFNEFLLHLITEHQLKLKIVDLKTYFDEYCLILKCEKTSNNSIKYYYDYNLEIMRKFNPSFLLRRFLGKRPKFTLFLKDVLRLPLRLYLKVVNK